MVEGTAQGLTPTEGIAPDVVLAHAGPAAWVDAEGRVVAANSQGACLHGMMKEIGPREDDAGSAQAAVRHALRSGAPVVWTPPPGTAAAAEGLDLLLLPGADGHHVAVLGRDTALETALCGALADSRSRYKDFVALSSDFSWEAGPDGRLVFVSPGGALGREGRDLVGADPAELLDPAERLDASTVFRTRAPVRDVEIWARNRSGQPVCLLVSAMPLADPNGVWVGARGICRDITAQRDRERALARVRNRERVRAHVVRTFRDETDTETMLDLAADALARGVGAMACLILRHQSVARHPSARGAEPVAPHRLDELVVGGRFSAGAETMGLDGLPETIPGADGPWEGCVGPRFVMILGTSYRQVINGAVILWRRCERGPWTEDDRLLIQDVASQVGIANEQIAHYEAIIDMSRTDALTGVLNRRAFLEDLERRHRRLERTSRNGALLYVDLDNFKLVNDVHGHARGDQVLVTLADILRNNTRPTDVVARLGGDEFAIWLEDADSTIACRKAQEFLYGASALRALSADRERLLDISVGVAVHDPDRPEDLRTLMERADAAMYAAKQLGKGRWFLAGPDAVTERGS